MIATSLSQWIDVINCKSLCCLTNIWYIHTFLLITCFKQRNCTEISVLLFSASNETQWKHTIYQLKLLKQLDSTVPNKNEKEKMTPILIWRVYQQLYYILINYYQKQKLNLEDRERGRKVRGDVDIADLTTVWFVGLDVNRTVGIPQPESAILATAEAVVAISIEPHRQHRSFVPLQHARFILWQLGPTRHLWRSLQHARWRRKRKLSV